MKRLFPAKFSALTLCLTLLFSACAPKGNMLATLTQLPFAATPPTFTPGPTRTPRAPGTVTPTPPGFEATSAVLTSTSASRKLISTATTAPTATQPICSPGTFDETVPGPDSPEQYIGKHYDQDNPPVEIEWLGSGGLREGFRWEHVRVQDREMYWILKAACFYPNGDPYWEIADALTLPQLNAQANEVVVDRCYLGNRKLSYVIAMGSFDPSTPAAPVVANEIGWPVQVVSAWEMKERFVPIGSRGLTCVRGKP